MTPGVLDDLVVIDLCPMMPGHYTTMILGDLGARVITVERPGTGDFSRTTVRGSYEAVNRNKESITLDLKNPAAQEVLHRLIQRADVVIEGFRPGVADRLGAGYEQLRKLSPSLIYCSLSSFGQTGPMRDRSGHDPTYLAISGTLSLSGDPDGPPSADIGSSIADLSGSWFAAIAILGAIRGRDRFGIGQHVDVALADAAFGLSQTRMIESLVNGGLPKSVLMARPGLGLFLTSDDVPVSVAAAEDHFWAPLCELIDRPEWQQGELATNRGRRARASEIRAAIAAAFRARPVAEWIASLDAAGIPYALVNDLDQAAQHAQERELMTWIDHPSLGRIPQVMFPARLPETPATIRRPPPELGEHTSTLLRELGYDDTAITELETTKAI